MSERPALRPHRFTVPLGGELPRWWSGGRRVETHLLNALGLLFPAGERFFVRTARSALPRIAEAALIEQVKGFIAQETHHAVQHERSFPSFEAHGYPMRKLAEALEALVENRLEPALPLSFRVSITAALEHFTATFADFAFVGPVFEDAEPTMRELFLWHAAEEIEHKCVAYDLLQSVDDSYPTRVAGMAMAMPLLMALWWGLTVALVLQDRPLNLRSAIREWTTSAKEGRLALRELIVALTQYLQPGFHPEQEQNFHHASDFFATRPG